MNIGLKNVINGRKDGWNLTPLYQTAARQKPELLKGSTYAELWTDYGAVLVIIGRRITE